VELVWTLGFLSLGLFDFTARVHGGWREYKAQFVLAENVFHKTFSAFTDVCCDVK
jgi:hypothetical protein